MNGQGQLVGVHGRSEKDDQVSMSTGKAVSTGTNQAVPISYFRRFDSGQSVAAVNTQAVTTDDFLAQAKALLGKKGREQEVISLTSLALKNGDNAEAYFYRAAAKSSLGDQQGAISDISQVIAIDPQLAIAYSDRGAFKLILGDKQGAIVDFNRAITIDPQYANVYNSRGVGKFDLGDYQGAVADYNKAILINPLLSTAFSNRGNAKFRLGDKQAAIFDYN